MESDGRKTGMMKGAAASRTKGERAGWRDGKKEKVVIFIDSKLQKVCSEVIDGWMEKDERSYNK